MLQAVKISHQPLKCMCVLYICMFCSKLILLLLFGSSWGEDKNSVVVVFILFFSFNHKLYKFHYYYNTYKWNYFRFVYFFQTIKTTTTTLYYIVNHFGVLYVKKEILFPKQQTHIHMLVVPTCMYMVTSMVHTYTQSTYTMILE